MTDSTPTTPLDLDAAIEAVARAVYNSGAEGYDRWNIAVPHLQDDYRGDVREVLTAIGYAALVEEVKERRTYVPRDQLQRVMDHRDDFAATVRAKNVEMEHLRADRDAAIARAEVLDAGMRSLAAENLELMDRAKVHAIAREVALAKVAEESWACWDQGHQFACVSPDDCQEHVNPYPNPFRAALTEVQAGAGESTDDECASCGEGVPRDECPKSKRECGHHCNHSWIHDACDWCGAELGEDEVTDSERRDDNGSLIGEDGFVDGPGGQRLKPYVRPQSVNPTDSAVQA